MICTRVYHMESLGEVTFLLSVVFTHADGLYLMDSLRLR